MTTTDTNNTIVGVPLAQASSDVYRPYYTEDNARSLQAIFDGLMNNQQDVFFSAAQAKCSVSTLYGKFVYAKKWLADFDTTEDKRYQRLAANVKIKRTDTGVIVKFARKANLSAILTASVVVPEQMKTNWLDNFIAWTSTAKEFDVYDSEKLLGGVVGITEADEQAMVRVCAQLGIELDMNRQTGKFKAMR